MTAKTPTGGKKSRKSGDSGPIDRNRTRGHEKAGSRDALGGPKGSNPDKHGGSGAGRQEGGSGAGRER